MSNIQNPLSLFTADGKLIWTKELTAGVHRIDVSRLAKGIYILKAGEGMQQILID